MSTYSSLVLLGLLLVLVRELKRGNAAVQADPSVHLEPGQRFRTLKALILEPLFALVVVGSLLVTDLEGTPSHAAAAAVGAVLGYALGRYRALTNFVAAVPALRGVILRSGLDTAAVLGLLFVVKIVAEQDLLPSGRLFSTIIAGLLGLLLVETLARVSTLVRRYRGAAAHT